MTTGELIRRLQEADPAGDTPVCVGNHDVYFVHALPAYYDGPLQQLVHDDSKRPYWSIVGAKITTHGKKIDVVTLSVQDLLFELPDAPVELEGSVYMTDQITKWRDQGRAT